MKMIIFKKRNMKLLTSKQKKSYENSKKKNEYKHAEDIKYGKDRGYCY